ncbi:GrpB family protein [Desertivirga brevis]|uniref:GrpB family protein n=1 Tax=Desertivirga brevis TaxID=2810310 RepID=UPI001A978FD0|nr:GrpB family protein [Pedobacter sp. SYSU D00873]
MIEIVPHKPQWKVEFEKLGSRLKDTLTGSIKGIHHIGSTAVSELGAKDVIDIQVTLAKFDPKIIKELEMLGFHNLEHINSDHLPAGAAHLPASELQKWFFQMLEPAVNLHVRISGRYNQRYALLCRDYLRNDDFAAKAYEAVKISLARYFPHDMKAYYDIKDPVFDVLMAGAEHWAASVNWKIPPSDIMI